MSDYQETLVSIAKSLSDDINPMTLGDKVSMIYNPLDYAWEMHRSFLTTYSKPSQQIMFLGMNPGPFGMAQTGIPFTDPMIASEWLGLPIEFEPPEQQHPKRPIIGAESRRTEGSGRRLWRWAIDRFGSARQFADHVLIWNYCPLCFLIASGANLTPDKLPKANQMALFQRCDQALREVIQSSNIRTVIALGRFAEAQCREALAESDVEVRYLLHPSPANPRAHREWPQLAEQAIKESGL